MPAVINKRKCAAQENICLPITTCPSEAIAYVADDNEPLGGRIIIDITLCDDCGVCVDACCGQAIEIKA